jgi:hypothetical protein
MGIVGVTGLPVSSVVDAALRLGIMRGSLRLLKI